MFSKCYRFRMILLILNLFTWNLWIWEDGLLKHFLSLPHMHNYNCNIMAPNSWNHPDQLFRSISCIHIIDFRNKLKDKLTLFKVVCWCLFFSLCNVAWADFRIWPDRDLHHQLPCGQDDVWTLRAGAQDIPEPQGEVHGEEHCSGQWVWQGAGGALQTGGRVPFPPCCLHRWTLPGGQCSLYELWDFCFYSGLF